MSLQARINALRERHATLEDQIHQESIRPIPDDTRISVLKRQKLRLNDEIQRLQSELEPG